MKTLAIAVATLSLLLGGCATASKTQNVAAKTSREAYVTYSEGQSYCYARLLDDAPFDRVCLKGDLVTYGPLTKTPSGYRPMPNYVSALFGAMPLEFDRNGRLLGRSDTVAAAANDNISREADALHSRFHAEPATMSSSRRMEGH